MVKIKSLIYFLIIMLNIILFVYLITFLKTFFTLENSIISYDGNNRIFNEENNYLDDSDKHLIWFIQITDLHISEFHDQTRLLDFEHFCNETISTVKPKAVLVTGDITDGKDASIIGSSQFESEWKMYNQALKKNKVLENIAWLDVRGNHDNFNVPNIKSPNNFFSQYGVMGHLGRSYKYELNLPSGDKYTFIAVDAVLSHGLKRPFNFYGNLYESDVKQLEEFSNSSKASNGTIWFGHYPMTTIISPKSVSSIMSNGVAYICGHLHTLGDLMPNMYTRYSNGLLELELADWKVKRMFRIMAFDGGIFTFHDYSKTQKIFILITNPKNMQFKTSREPAIKQIKYSTYIRFLVFSKYSISKADVYVNNEHIGQAQKSKNAKNSPLYVVPWAASKYQKDIYTIRIVVKDSNMNEESVSHQFTTQDSLTLQFGFMRTLLLTSENPSIAKGLFFIGFTLILNVLLFFRFYRTKFTVRFISCGPIRTFILTYLRRFVLLSSIDYVFWALLISTIYIPIGPWFIGEVMDSHIGVCFIWGMFVDGTLLNTDLQYLAGFQHILIFIIPLIFDLSYQIETRFTYIHFSTETHQNNEPRSNGIIQMIQVLLNLIRYIYANFLFVFLTIISVYQIYELGVCYALIAAIFNPIKTWSLCMAFYLRYKCMNLNENDFNRFIYLKTTQLKTLHKNASEMIEEESLLSSRE